MNKVNFLVFSKDRAMQLRCFLESLEKHSIDDIYLHVLYKTSNEINQKHYDELEKLFPNVRFIPEFNLILQTKQIVDTCKYIVYCVDDCIFTYSFSIQNIINLLEENKDALGFSLRLGLNTQYCYMNDFRQRELSEYENITDKIIKYDWTKYLDKLQDYGYPLEVSSSCYRSKDVSRMLYPTLKNVPAIEINMDKFKMQYIISHPYLLCYNTSVAFCNPINKVANDSGIRFGKNKSYSSSELTQKYEDGYIIDIIPFAGVISNSVHQEVDFDFIKRKSVYGNC